MTRLIPDASALWLADGGAGKDPLMTTEPEAIPADVLELADQIFDDAVNIAGCHWECDPGREALTEAISCAILADRASRAPVDGAGWRPIETAPKDGTHILAKLHRAACDDMDDRRQPAFTEIREIFYRPYTQFGMDLPWHAGDPMDSHEGLAPDHMGEAVPIGWMPLPAAPGTHPGTVDGAEAKPVAWGKANLIATLGRSGHDEVQCSRSEVGRYTLPLYTHPAPSSPDAEMVKRLGALLEPHVDWEGGPPSRATAAEARASELQREVERLQSVILRAADILYHNLGRQDEKVRDVEPLLRAALQQEGK